MFRTWWKKIVRTPSRSITLKPERRALLSLESLENRIVPSFSGPQNFAVAGAVGGAPLAIATGGFNGDGRTDLAVANSIFGAPGISLFLNDSNPF